MELTREQVKERLISAKNGNLFSAGIVKELCTALLAEMDKPKLFYGVDEWVKSADVQYNDKNGKHLFTIHYDHTMIQYIQYV